MADLLSFAKGAGGVFGPCETLDAAWAEAEAFGRVGVDTTLMGTYRATISFQTAGGSHVFAHGEGREPVAALRAAMCEARQLGAGGT